MSKKRRITYIFTGLFMLLLSIVLGIASEDGYDLIVEILAFTFMIRGIRLIRYYFGMARFMVGGRIILYQGVITLDFGIVNFIMSDVPRVYIMLYLLACYSFSGIVDLLRAFEARKLKAPIWKWKMGNAMVHLLVVTVSLIFIRRPEAVVYIYASGLFYSALIRIAQAFTRNEIAYIT